MRHTLPKAVSRKNVQLPGYVPEGRLFGAFTTRGEGITQATYRYPKVVQAIHHLAFMRGGEASSEGYLSAQVNRAKKLQVHKDKSKYSTSWLIGLGDFTGGRLWSEDPLGQHPPPCVTSEWQNGLRGSFHNVHNAWFTFDPTEYHAVEEVKSGTRASVALFSPRSWKRIPAHALTELADVGFHPTLSAMRAEVSEQEALEGEAEEEDIWMDPPPADQQQKFTNSPPEEEAILQKWCSQEHVSLPTDTLNVSDGSIKPLSGRKEPRDQITSGHVKKSNLCKGCLLSEGGSPKFHRRVRDVDRATHVLHIDIAGPYIESHEGHHYFLVGALRLPDRPLLIDARLLKTRKLVEVCAALERMTSFFGSLSFDGLRSQIHLALRDCTPTGQGSSPPCAFRSSCPITAASITPSPQGMTHKLTEQQKGPWVSRRLLVQDVSPPQDCHKSSGDMRWSMQHRASSAHLFRENKDHLLLALKSLHKCWAIER